MKKIFRVYDIEMRKYEPELFRDKREAKDLRHKLNSQAQRRRYTIDIQNSFGCLGETDV